MGWLSRHRPSHPRRQPAVFVALVALAVAAFAGATYYVVRAQVDAVYAAADRNLQAIGELRLAELEAWLNERLDDGRAAAASPFIAAAMEGWWTGGRTGAQSVEIENQLRVTLEAGPYENVLLVGLDGRLLAAARQGHAIVGSATRALAKRVTVPGASSALTDVASLDVGGHMHIDVAAAIRDHAGDPVAVLILRSDPAMSLDARLLAWPIENPSGETLLVRRDGDRVVYLSIPRLAGDRRPVGIHLAQVDAPVVQAALGRTGRSEGPDYRGVAVLADLRPVPGTAWYLVNKMDLAEVAAEAWWRGGLTLLLAVLSALLVGSLAALLYVSQRRRILGRLHDAQQERTAAVRHFERLFALAHDAFLLLEPSGRIVEANTAAENLYGFSRDELLGMAVSELRAPETRALLERDWAAAAGATGVQFQTTHLRRDGTPVQVDVSSSVLEIDGEPYRQKIIRDITERKTAEAALNQQLDELRRWNALALGREGRILALKAEINELLGALGRPPRYDEHLPDAGETDHG